MKRCFIIHRFGPYEAPKQVTNSSGSPELAQRRECTHCGAVDYRRVIIHN